MSQPIARLVIWCLAVCACVPCASAIDSQHKTTSAAHGQAVTHAPVKGKHHARQLATAARPAVSSSHHHGTSSSATAHAGKSKSKQRSAQPLVVKRKGGLRAYSHSILRAAGRPFHLIHTARKPAHNEPGDKIPEPVAENVQDAGALGHVYRLYDEGLNARLSGNFDLATKKLLEASNTYISTKSGLTLEAMIEFELGQAAELSGNLSVAADAYTRCLRIKPNLVDACVHLSSMLMKAGESKAALGRARETVAANPSDPAAHELLALVLDKSGFAEDAKMERRKAELLLHSQPLPNPASGGQQNQAPPVVAPLPQADSTPDSEVVSPTEKETKPPEQPVDSDVMKQ